MEGRLKTARKKESQIETERGGGGCYRGMNDNTKREGRVKTEREKNTEARQTDRQKARKQARQAT
jgi:hypothetical protein